MDNLNTIINLAIEKKSGPPRISVGAIIGGLSAQKQKRVLERGCDILVATPGRLWDLMKAVSRLFATFEGMTNKQDETIAADIRGLRFLVLDEADRMIENGHFAELENIVRLTERGEQ